ncbi:MAG TPA: MFS transporter, partial [Dehalococcoidales bacterium]
MSSSIGPTNTPAVSRPSGWIEVGKLFVILTAVMAMRNSFGVFFTSIQNQFDMSRAGTSAIYSSFNALAAIFTILGGWALDRFGPKAVFVVMGILTAISLLLTGRTTSSWQLFFTYSLLLAAGVGGGFSITLATVSRWFSKRRGLALGMTLSGEGAGTLAVAPLATFLIASFNWQTAYLIIGLFAGLLMVGFALFLKPVPRSVEITAAAHTSSSPHTYAANAIPAADFSLKQAARTRSFWFLGLIYLLFSFNFYLVLAHIVPHATDLNFSASRSAIIISLIGA